MRNSNRVLKYPVKMQPVYKDYIWGGSRLKSEWNKNTPYKITAESWELSAHKNGESLAANGILKGLTLTDVIKRFGKNSVGSAAVNTDRFPVLIKLIDSEKKLSVQVHPDDEYALENEGDYGKTEMWYIASAGENASILCGFSHDITRDEYLKYIENGTITEHMNRINVRQGDVFFISPGTVHAICEGTLIVEIQQNSDVTYRVFDYGRKGADGALRPLHINKALDVSRLEKESFDGKPSGIRQESDGYSCTRLSSCRYFTADKYEVISSCCLHADMKSFHGIVITEGEGYVEYQEQSCSFKKGETFFIPAGMGEYKITGECGFILTTLQ